MDTKVNCTICNLNTLETLSHLLIHCPIYKPIRNKFIRKYLTRNMNGDESNLENLESLTIIDNFINLSDIFYFVINALQIRSFIIN